MMSVQKPPNGPQRSSATTAALLLLSGCQASLPPLKPDTSEGPITYMMSMRQNTSAGLDRLTTRFEVANREDIPDYRSWRDWWCPRYVRGSNPPPPDLQSLVRSYCEAHGGVHDRNKACITRTEPRTVLFYIGVFKSSGCEGTAVTARALVIELKPGREHSTAFALRGADRKTRYDRVAACAGISTNHPACRLAKSSFSFAALPD